MSEHLPYQNLAAKSEHVSYTILNNARARPGPTVHLRDNLTALRSLNT